MSPNVPERFQVLTELRATDAAVLYRARDRVLQREVVLQFAATGLSDTFKDRDAREVILREARALARVRHPQVVRVLDVLETDDGPLLVLEPLQSETLAERLRAGGPMEPTEVAELGSAIAEVLEAVHAAGLVHRGLSSQCIAIHGEGVPVLSGFHFCKSMGDDLSMSGTSIIYVEDSGLAALPMHPAPEQLQGLPADARSDVFGLGWVLWECLTPEAPFPGGVLVDGAEAGSLAKARRGVPKKMAQVIERCLAIDPTRRFGSAAEVAAALRPFFGEDDGAPATTAAPRSSDARRPALVAAAVLGVALVLAAGWFAKGSAWSGSDEVIAQTDPLDPESRGLGGVREGAPLAPEDVLHDRYENSHALLIGIGEEYGPQGFPPLANAKRDVEAIAERLRADTSANWDVETLVGADATGDEIVEALHRLADATEPNDRAFIYYAGHGASHERTEDTGWIIPADGVPERRSSWVRFREFGDLFAESQAKHVLVAMDCCYGGRLTTTRSAKQAEFERRYLTKPAYVVMTSGRPDEEVSDGLSGGHSPFAEAFLGALDRSDPITSSELFVEVLSAFHASGTPHTPSMGHPPGVPAGGQFVFFAGD